MDRQDKHLDQIDKINTSLLSQNLNQNPLNVEGSTCRRESAIYTLCEEDTQETRTFIFAYKSKMVYQNLHSISENSKVNLEIYSGIMNHKNNLYFVSYLQDLSAETRGSTKSGQKV